MSSILGFGDASGEPGAFVIVTGCHNDVDNRFDFFYLG